MNYYNDISPEACAWLRELIVAKLIPQGHVDQRSIADVTPTDLADYAQCHFFAGIGGWSYALHLAGWPATGTVWTGSCPCQPFSCAGQGRGEADPRHLWPQFRRLISECKPATIFGEQVASKAGREWLAGVRADLEAMGYAVGAADLCAAGVGAPHIRQRLFWVAESQRHAAEPWRFAIEPTESARADSAGAPSQPGRSSDVGGLADNGGSGLEVVRVEPTREECATVERSGEAGGLGQPESQQVGDTGLTRRQSEPAWSNFDLIPCLDGKTRRVESGSFPLVARLPRGMVPSGDPSIAYAQACPEGRVMRLRGYGNSIVPHVAATFIKAFVESVF